MTDVSKIFEELFSSSHVSSQPAQFRRLNSENEPFICYLCFSKEDGPFVAFFHHENDITLKSKPLVQGLKIEAVKEHGRVGVRLVPTDVGDLQIFYSFCAYLNKKLRALHNANEIARELLRELKLWKVFFGSGAKPMTFEATIGLIGELITLSDIITFSSLSEMEALDCWKGRPRGLHDFELPKCALEVKSSIEKTHMRFNISVANQLDDLLGKELFIVHQLFLNDPQGTSLVSILQDLEALLETEIARRKLAEIVNSAGYHPIHNDIYSSYDYRVSYEGNKTYEVVDGFPRIISLSFAPDIIIKSYSIEVDACASFERGKLKKHLEKKHWI